MALLNIAFTYLGLMVRASVYMSYALFHFCWLKQHVATLKSKLAERSASCWHSASVAPAKELGSRIIKAYWYFPLAYSYFCSLKKVFPMCFR